MILERLRRKKEKEKVFCVCVEMNIKERIGKKRVCIWMRVNGCECVCVCIWVEEETVLFVKCFLTRLFFLSRYFLPDFWLSFLFFFFSAELGNIFLYFKKEWKGKEEKEEKGWISPSNLTKWTLCVYFGILLAFYWWYLSLNQIEKLQFNLCFVFIILFFFIQSILFNNNDNCC